MKKLLFLFLSLMLTGNILAHCGTCGVGGSADDHKENEDKEHHDKDARFEAAKEKKEALMDENDSESDDD